MNLKSRKKSLVKQELQFTQKISWLRNDHLHSKEKGKNEVARVTKERELGRENVSARQVSLNNFKFTVLLEAKSIVLSLLEIDKKLEPNHKGNFSCSIQIFLC